MNLLENYNESKEDRERNNAEHIVNLQEQTNEDDSRMLFTLVYNHKAKSLGIVSAGLNKVDICIMMSEFAEDMTKQLDLETRGRIDSKHTTKVFKKGGESNG